jgi:hypothetical protein
LRDSHTRSAVPGSSCFLYDGSALPVLFAARDLIHAGWRLLHHPLYGNYRPHQQPYRTVLLAWRDAAADSDHVGEIRRTHTDPESLHFIEAVLALFGTSRILAPDMAPPSFLKDCAALDFELMRLPLRQAALPDCLVSTA